MKWKSWWKEESDACTWPGERSQLSAEMRERVILMDNATIYNESQASLPVRKEPELGNEYWTTLKWPAGMQAALCTMCTQWTPSQNAALWGESMNMLNHVSSIWGLKLNLYTLRTVTVINQISLAWGSWEERSDSYTCSNTDGLKFPTPSDHHGWGRKDSVSAVFMNGSVLRGSCSPGPRTMKCRLPYRKWERCKGCLLYTSDAADES